MATLKTVQPTTQKIIEINEAKEIHIGIDTFESKGTNYTFCSLREYYLDKESGEFRPSKKGFTLPIDTLEETIPEMITALQSTLDAFRAQL